MADGCPVCGRGPEAWWATVEGYDYSRCASCGSIHIDADVLREIDDGRVLVTYAENYWEAELPSARERAFGAALARMAEVMYYARIPVRTFLDIGTGPGYFLDAVAAHLPNNRFIFYGVEKFPPPEEYRTKSSHYRTGEIGETGLCCDAGLCMEMIEHLTPTMLSELFRALATVSNDRAIYLFNTGMPEFVMHEDPGYLDPVRRGHIVSYSAAGVQAIATAHGFRVCPIPGKTWAFVAELHPSSKVDPQELVNRIWSPVRENIEVLDDPDMGSVLKILGQETVRAYL
jgi:hypothetical protein